MEAPAPQPSDQAAGAGTAAPSTEGPAAPPMPAAVATAGAISCQSRNNDRHGPKPLSVRGVPKKCHDTIQIVQEDFIVTTLKQERQRASDVVEETDRDLNYLRSLLTLVSFLHKFLVSNYEARLVQVAYEDTKPDEDWINEHK